MNVEYRFLSDNELINSVVSDAGIELEHIDMNQIFERLTPAKRRLAETFIELYKRSLHQVSQRLVIRTAYDIYNLMRPLIGDLSREEFWIIAINHAGKVVAKERHSIGGLAGALVDIRLVIKYLLQNNATQCAICHNHPSGTRRPSPQDQDVTEKLRKALDLFNIRLIDHVIICQEEYYSFCEEGMI